MSTDLANPVSRPWRRFPRFSVLRLIVLVLTSLVVVLDSPESHTLDKLDLKSHEPISIFSVFYVLNLLFTMFRRIDTQMPLHYAFSGYALRGDTLYTNLN
jgi:hypothetical protein